MTDDEEKKDDKRIKTKPANVVMRNIRADSQISLYNPGEIREETPPKSVVKISTTEVKAPALITPIAIKPSKVENRAHVAPHTVKVSNRVKDTTSYVRRPK